MANPNLNNATAVYADNALVRLVDTNETLVVTNAAASGKVLLLESIYVSNVDGVNSCDLTLNMYAAATNTGNATKIAHTVSVPADAVLLPVLKDGTIVVKEAQSIYAVASAGNDLHIVASWKELS